MYREYATEEMSAAERHQLVERALHWRQQGEAERQKWEKEAQQRRQKEGKLRFWEEETGQSGHQHEEALQLWLQEEDQPWWEPYKSKQERLWEDNTEEEGEDFLRQWCEEQDEEGGIMDTDDVDPSDYNLYY